MNETDGKKLEKNFKRLNLLFRLELKRQAEIEKILAENNEIIKRNPENKKDKIPKPDPDLITYSEKGCPKDKI